MTYDFTTSTMSYDDRTMVVRCRTILDEVVRRRTILDEVVRQRRTTIAQISYDEPRRRSMPCDVVQHRTIILIYPTLKRIAASFWTWPKTTNTSWNWLRRRATSHDYAQLTPDGPRSPRIHPSYVVVWHINDRCDHQLYNLKFNTRPLHDVARSSHNIIKAMSLIYIVRWRCATSCDLVRYIKIILRYSTMHGKQKLKYRLISWEIDNVLRLFYTSGAEQY